MWGYGLDSDVMGWSSEARSYEHDNEHSGFIKSWEFLDQMWPSVSQRLCSIDSKIWLILNSTYQKSLLNYEETLQFRIKKEKANNVLEKLVLLQSVWYAITCHIISITNYHFTWCSVVINVMFNAVKPLSIVSERTAINKDKCGKTIDVAKLFILNYFERTIWKLSLQGRSFFRITNYQGF
jgi:hypothetical protein